jgi:hypothetical protein
MSKYSRQANFAQSQTQDSCSTKIQIAFHFKTPTREKTQAFSFIDKLSCKIAPGCDVVPGCQAEGQHLDFERIERFGFIEHLRCLAFGKRRVVAPAFMTRRRLV